MSCFKLPNGNKKYLSSSFMHDLTGKVSKSENHYFANGGLADVYKGVYTPNSSDKPTQVAIKVIRGSWIKAEYLVGLRNKLVREGIVWSQLHHRNITPFLGICYDLDYPSAPCLICPFYANGNVSTYLQNNHEADRMKLCAQLANGLAYLHSLTSPIIHGDIKASNILVNDSNEASLADFGLSRVLETTGFTTKSVAGTSRWMACELIAPEEEDDEDRPPQVTTATDVWAFAMTVLEIFTGRVPYSHILFDTAVILSVMQGGRPISRTCPQISNEVWSVLETCWDADAEKRPSMRTLALFFDSACNVRPGTDHSKASAPHSPRMNGY